MAECWFYHLTRQPVERALPALIERALERGWRSVVQGLTDERLRAIDEALWTFDEASFIPHGGEAEGDPDLQQVWLTCATVNPNRAAVRFFVEGADPGAVDATDYQRLIVLFDGSDDAQVAIAREQWRAARAKGGALAYWRQQEDGRWEKIA